MVRVSAASPRSAPHPKAHRRSSKSPAWSWAASAAVNRAAAGRAKWKSRPPLMTAGTHATKKAARRLHPRGTIFRAAA